MNINISAKYHVAIYIQRKFHSFDYLLFILFYKNTFWVLFEKSAFKQLSTFLFTFFIHFDLIFHRLVMLLVLVATAHYQLVFAFIFGYDAFHEIIVQYIFIAAPVGNS